MHLGESLLAIGAVVMFTVGALRLNTMRLDGQTRMLESEFRTTALSLAQSYVEQAQRLSFDEALADSHSVTNLHARLTAPAAMGPDAGETTIDTFDDLDDLHGHTEAVITPRGAYRVSLTAAYADSVTLAPSGAPSLLKWVTASVSSRYFRDTVRVSYLCGFH